MKPGYLTTEFATTVGSSLWAMISNFIPHTSVWAQAIPAIASAAYSLARAITKAASAQAAGTALAPSASPKAVEHMLTGG
jgi:hypothetical protein